MKITLNNSTGNPSNLLRRAGYQFQRHSGDQMSFIRPLSRSGYPRFHIYVSWNNQQLTLNLHLDQKRHTYGETTRHHGEYDNEGPLQEEIKRLKSILHS